MVDLNLDIRIIISRLGSGDVQTLRIHSEKKVNRKEETYLCYQI